MRERTCPIDDTPQPRLSKPGRAATLVGTPWLTASWRLSLYHVERMRRPVEKRGVPWTTSPPETAQERVNLVSRSCRRVGVVASLCNTAYQASPSIGATTLLEIPTPQTANDVVALVHLPAALA